jgi:hypothetical protein
MPVKLVIAILVCVVIGFILHGRQRMSVASSAESRAVDFEAPPATSDSNVIPDKNKVDTTVSVFPQVDQISATGPGNLKKHSLSMKMTPTHIHYKLEDGFGVAFGDVLLGEPKAGTAESGTTEAPVTSRWPRGPIAYFIKSEVVDPDRILRAIDYFNRNTPAQFVPYSQHEDALVFEQGRGCKSYVGKIGGHQPIIIEPGCQTQEILHEMMHALGFVHEQSRTDRDSFIKMKWENIDEQYKINFDIVPATFMALVPYTNFDFNSIMIYAPTIFSKGSGLPTMEPLNGETIQPVPTGLSKSDLARLEKLFAR